MSLLRQPFPVAVCGLLLAFGFQAFLVYGLYSGDWLGLYYTGAEVALPPLIEAEAPPRAPNALGFDGQYYHVVAHDPLPAPEFAAFVDNPRLRWRRILAPALAYAAALGQDAWVDRAYVAVLLGFSACGVWWMARLAVATDLPAWLGLAFLTLPATFISLERLTMDVALAALCAAFAVALRNAGKRWLGVVLALAPLARETGIALAGAWGAASLLRRRWGGMATAALALVPLAAWSFYVHSHTPTDATAWFGSVPLGGLAARMFELFPEPAPTLGLKVAAGLEYVALLGVWAAIVLVAIELKRAPAEPLALAAAMTLAIFVFLSKEDIWRHSYGFARTLSPAFLLLGLLGVRERRAWLGLPWALTAPRIGYQLALLVLSGMR
ncbi:MAG: hypothetical protein KDC27_19350 [Acidobacteria bacterium]|nr:hypothetical protein [Acidobacteriota bacterium]